MIVKLVANSLAFVYLCVYVCVHVCVYVCRGDFVCVMGVFWVCVCV